MEQVACNARLDVGSQGTRDSFAAGEERVARVMDQYCLHISVTLGILEDIEVSET